MKKKILIALIIIFLVVLGYLGYLYYGMFSNNKKETKKEVNKKENNIDGVYVCTNKYGNYKFYSTKTDNEYSICVKKEFSCNNCDINKTYMEGMIVYSVNHKVYVYDFEKQKTIQDFETDSSDISFYKQDNKLYGFQYSINYLNKKKGFYNIELKKTTAQFKGRLYMSKEYGEDIAEDYTENYYNENIINNDIAPFLLNPGYSNRYNYQFGLINLKTGKVILEPTKESIIYTGTYYITGKDKTNSKGMSIFNKEGKIVFNNTEDLLDITSMQSLSDSLFTAFDYDYFYIINMKGEIQNKVKISIISNKLLRHITNQNAKDRYSETELENHFTYFDYGDDEKIMIFSYYDQYYEEDASVAYKYNMNNKSLEEIENYKQSDYFD